MMMFKNMLKLFSKTELQEDKIHPTYLSQTILNRLFGRVLEKEGVKVSYAKHTVKDLSSNRLTILTTLKHKLDCFAYARNDDSYAKHTLKNLFTSLPIHLFTFKKAAFTLAEVLITLAIIGVVAALTLPTLIQNHQKQAYVTGLKKAYANLQNAFAKMAYDEGVTDWRQTSCASMGLHDCSGQSAAPNTLDKKDICLENLKNQFNIASYSVNENDLSNPVNYSGSLATFKTVDGMIYTLKYGEIAGIEMGYILGLKDVVVDVNGNKGPNKMGRDQFYFVLDYSKNKVSMEGLELASWTGQPLYKLCTTESVNKGYYWECLYCTARVLIEGKMDY